MPLLSHLEWVGLAKEATQGTPLAPTIFIPCTAIKPEDLIEEVKDESFVGNPTMLRAAFAGIKDSQFDIDGIAYPEAFGNFMVALGLADTVTGAGPYTHAFALTNPQPPTYTLREYTVYEYRDWPGQMLDQLDIKIDSKGSINWAAKFKGWPSVASSTATPAWPSTTPFLPWMVTASVGGSSNARVIKADISIKRSVEAIHTLNGVQAPNTMFAGPIEATGKLTLIYNDNTDMNHFLNYDEPAVVLTATQSANQILTLNFNKGAWVKGVRDVGKSFTQLSVDIDGVYNATDGGPFSASLKNAVSTQY